MHPIRGEIVIHRPPQVVFDWVADERNEPTYNHRMVQAEKLSEGPIGNSTRFGASIKSGRRTTDMIIEFTQYDRPHLLASTTQLSSMAISGVLTFEPDPAGTRMRWTWDIKPKGALKLLSPFFGWMGRRQEQAIWSSLKRFLEATPVSRTAVSSSTPEVQPTESRSPNLVTSGLRLLGPTPRMCPCGKPGPTPTTPRPSPRNAATPPRSPPAPYGSSSTAPTSMIKTLPADQQTAVFASVTCSVSDR